MMRFAYVVTCENVRAPVAVFETEAEAEAYVQECYEEAWFDDCPTAGDRMALPLEQYIRETPGLYKTFETRFYLSKED